MDAVGINIGYLLLAGLSLLALLAILAAAVLLLYGLFFKKRK